MSILIFTDTDTWAHHLQCYVSQFTVEKYYFADCQRLFKQPRSVMYHCNHYEEEILEKYGSVLLSVLTLLEMHTLSLFTVEFCI